MLAYISSFGKLSINENPIPLSSNEKFIPLF
jgi:hypothetical protein